LFGLGNDFSLGQCDFDREPLIFWVEDLLLGQLEGPRDMLDDSIRVKKQGIPADLVLQPGDQPALLPPLERTPLLLAHPGHHILPEPGVPALADHLSDVFKGRLHVQDAAEHDLVVGACVGLHCARLGAELDEREPP
jgi:hypothetical protein